MSVRAIEAAIVEKERWIRSKLEQWQAWRLRRAAPIERFADGAALPFLGRPLTIRLRGAPTDAGHPGRPVYVISGTAQELLLPMPPDAGDSQVRQAVQAWMKDEALRILGERLDELARRGGVQPLSWKLSSARTQWGSCNEDGTQGRA